MLVAMVFYCILVATQAGHKHWSEAEGDTMKVMLGGGEGL